MGWAGDCGQQICHYSGCEALPINITAINSDVVEVFDSQEVSFDANLTDATPITSKISLMLSEPRRFPAAASIPSLNLVLFAGGVTASDPNLPEGGWNPWQTSSVVDIYTIYTSGIEFVDAPSISHSQYNLSTTGRIVAGCEGNKIVLVRHHENAIFDNTGYVFDGSSWVTTSHPGQCGMQDSSTSMGHVIIFLSACEPEALLFNTLSQKWIQQKLSHTSSPSRIVAAWGNKLLFAGRTKGMGEEGDCGGTTHYDPMNGLQHQDRQCPMPAPPSGSSGLCGWDGLGSFRSASCGSDAGIYYLPDGFVKASVEISNLANPAQSISRTVALPAHIPEVDATLSLPDQDKTKHLATDTWTTTCQARVNGKSTAVFHLRSSGPQVCITPDDITDDEFVVYGGQMIN